MGTTAASIKQLSHVYAVPAQEAGKMLEDKFQDAQGKMAQSPQQTAEATRGPDGPQSGV
jgi:hypothetical protein